MLVSCSSVGFCFGFHCFRKGAADDDVDLMAFLSLMSLPAGLNTPSLALVSREEYYIIDYVLVAREGSVHAVLTGSIRQIGSVWMMSPRF
jgi:hypothetical protein